METDRKTRIADAAIALLGSAGAKGLTHRAVDAEAGLPLGSTSFYCRTRHELLTLALLRHAALDLADLQADAHLSAKSDWGLDDFIDLLIARLADWLSPGKRPRLVARFELFLVASREPELADIVTQQRQRFLAASEAGLRKAGVKQAVSLAPRLLVIVDGILLDQVRANGAVLNGEQQKALLKAVLVDCAI